MTEYIRLKESNCKNCYKCIRHCPVKAISFSGDQAHIISENCILCGECFVVCPQNAKFIRDDIGRARSLLSSGAPVVASLAPSFVANYPDICLSGMEKALLALGFAAVEETAIGATIVKREYERLIATGEQTLIVSSCCSTVNLMIEKYFPEVLPSLAKVISPMQAHCKDIKRRQPEAKTVFIGPCISKKREADGCPSDVDCALTFEELSEWLHLENIELEPIPDHDAKSRARFFPTAGGILKTMDKNYSQSGYIAIDGHDNCIKALRDISTGKVTNCFVEMSACTGACIGGPVMSNNRHSSISGFMNISKYAGDEDYIVEMPNTHELLRIHPALEPHESYPSEAELNGILMQMGKIKPTDELNCGSCGYNSCREKAIAVFQGKADFSMCTPFLRDKAETFSSSILRNSPNGIIVLSDAMEVQQINPAALSILNLKSAADIVGDQVVRILDPGKFMEVRNTGRSLRNDRIYLAEYKKYVEQTIVFDKTYQNLLCLMRDVTDEELARGKKERISRQTMEITDKVIEKQMRIVQEIASLLGETTAETKIALTKLKESLRDE